MPDLTRNNLLEIPWLSHLFGCGLKILVQTVAQKLQDLYTVCQLLLPRSHCGGGCTEITVEDALGNGIVGQELQHGVHPGAKPQSP